MTLPPIQMPNISSTTAARLANLKPSSSSSSPRTMLSRSSLNTSRATSQTISSSQKQQTEAAARAARQNLPTIAGSPSVGPGRHEALISAPEATEENLSQMASSVSGISVKETPTKIPRIASRSSAVTSPFLKSVSAVRKGAPNSANTTHAVDPVTDEFGVLDNKIETSTAMTDASERRYSVRLSPNGVRHVSASSSLATVIGGAIPRKATRDSISFGGLRKSSTGSVASFNSAVGSESHRRLSALSPSKGFSKLLSPKSTHSSSRVSTSSNLHQTLGSPAASQHSLSTPSPGPSTIDEEEVLGDEEMMQYIRRQQARKMANGAKKEDLDSMLNFPEPQPPSRPLSPACTYPFFSLASIIYRFLYFICSTPQERSTSLFIGL